MYTPRLWNAPFMIVSLCFLGWVSDPVFADVAEVTDQVESGIAIGNQGLNQLEKMIYELEKILQMKDASDGVKTLTQASIDRAHEALRFYKEALRYADDGKEMSKRDEGAFIKQKKDKDPGKYFNPKY